MECSQPAVFIDGDKLCVLMTLVKVTGTYIGGCACTVQCIYHLGRMHKHTQTIISLLYFLITVTIGGPLVRIYLSPLLPPIHFAPPPQPLLPGSRATMGPGSPLTWLQRQDKRNFSRKDSIWPPPHSKQTLYILCVFTWERGRLSKGDEVERKRESTNSRSESVCIGLKQRNNQ